MCLFLPQEKVFMKFNFDLIETNTINIFLLIALLVYAKNVSFGPSLEKRQEEIIFKLENAQNDFVKAADSYYIAEKTVTQNFFCLQSWKNIYDEEKKTIVQNKYLLMKNVLDQNFLASKKLVQNLETKYFLCLQKYVLYIVAVKILRRFFSLSQKEQSKLLEITLYKIGGKK